MPAKSTLRQFLVCNLLIKPYLVLKPYFHWSTLPIYLLIWLLTTGWAYIILPIAINLHLKWLIGLCTTYIGVLSLPGPSPIMPLRLLLTSKFAKSKDSF